jgi:hypothetical protein
MRRLNEDIRDVRAPPEALARWALQTPLAAQEATYAALAYFVNTEHAAVNLMPVPAVLMHEQAVLDPDGFLRQPRGAVELFRLRSSRAICWMDLFIFFRERFPAPAQRTPGEALYSLAQTFSRHDDVVEAAVDLLVRECILPELEEIVQRAITYPPLQLLLQRLRDSDPQRSADARRLAAEVLGELKGKRLWAVRKRLVATATRAILGARPLLEELDRGGLKVDRAQAARGFARRLEEAIGELSGTPVLPEAIVEKLSELASAAKASPAKQDAQR